MFFSQKSYIQCKWDQIRGMFRIKKKELLYRLMGDTEKDVNIQKKRKIKNW